MAAACGRAQRRVAAQRWRAAGVWPSAGGKAGARLPGADTGALTRSLRRMRETAVRARAARIKAAPARQPGRIAASARDRPVLPQQRPAGSAVFYRAWSKRPAVSEQAGNSDVLLTASGSAGRRRARSRLLMGILANAPRSWAWPRAGHGAGGAAVKRLIGECALRAPCRLRRRASPPRGTDCGPRAGAWRFRSLQLRAPAARQRCPAQPDRGSLWLLRDGREHAVCYIL